MLVKTWPFPRSHMLARCEARMSAAKAVVANWPSTFSHPLSQPTMAYSGLWSVSSRHLQATLSWMWYCEHLLLAG